MVTVSRRHRFLAFCETHVARGTVRSSATSTMAIEFGEILTIIFCTGRALKRIPPAITAPAFVQNICRPVRLNCSVESLRAGLADPTNFRAEDTVCDSSGEFSPPTRQSRIGGFADKACQPDSVEAPPVFCWVWYRQ